jgi:crotonobetainyl-CoA:carnitine CoA-transferase CaiB-like acyl-CoA transferase
MQTSTSQHLLDQLRQLAGLPGEAASCVRIDGADPVVRTSIKAAETGAAAIAAAGMAAAWLWRQKSGRMQEVRVDAATAAAAMQSYKFMKIDGQPPGAVMDVLTNAYRLKDGRWIYLHCNFPNLAEKNCLAIGARMTPESIREHVARWEGEPLEEALFAAGGVGALVRSEEEWRALPQGVAAAAEPVLEIVRIGDAPAQPLPNGDRPLSGVRVLDLTRVLAGPTCAKNLAEHGADVLRVSRPGLADSGVLDFDTGVGKLSAHVDMRDPAQMAQMRELARGCDVFSQAYRPGTLDARGLSPQELAELRPGIVCITLNAWGFRGPWKDRRGYDTVVQAANGMAWNGMDAPPLFAPVAQQDYVAGYLMAYGAMVALARRASEGGSWLVRVSLAGCGEWIRGHGLVAPEDYERCPMQVADEVVGPLLRQTSSPVGVISHLGPVTYMSLTPPRWDRDIAAAGSSPREWPGR